MRLRDGIAGIAIRGANGRDQLALVSQLRASVGDLLGAPASASSGARAPVDQIYESALRATLQIIAAR